MKKGFVPTQNYKRLKEAEKLVARRGAREAGLVLVRGVYGIGKSELTERWAADSGYVFVRAKETWTKRTVLEEIGAKMGLATDGRLSDLQNRIIAQLAVSMVPIIIDEADHLVDRHSAAKLEVIRDMTDLTGIMCFLVGMEGFPVMVARYGHIASRVAKVVELEPLNLEDVRATVTAKSEVEMSAEVVQGLFQQSRGRMRLVLSAIANIEQWAAANSWQRVDAEHIKGRALVAEFTSTQAALRGMA